MSDLRIAFNDLVAVLTENGTSLASDYELGRGSATRGISYTFSTPDRMYRIGSTAQQARIFLDGMLAEINLTKGQTTPRRR